MYSVTNKEKCDTDKNGYKKSYGLCIQYWKFITMQTKKIEKYYVSSKCTNPVLKQYIT